MSRLPVSIWIVLVAGCGFRGQATMDAAGGSGDGAPDSGDATTAADAPPDATCDVSARVYRRELTFANATRAEALVDFPILVALQDGVNIDYAVTADDGHDLHFVDADGTPLAHELERWTKTGTSYVWVKVPQIDASSDVDHITMLYGDAALPATPPDPTLVWSAGYVGVWHLAGGQPGTATDSSSTPNPGTAAGSTIPTLVSGQIGDGLTFDGSDDRLAVASEASFSATAFTLEAWANVPSPVPAGWGALVNHARQTGDEYGLWRSADISSHFHFRWTNAGSKQSINFSNAFTTNQWHYVAATLDSATTTATTYLDGAIDQRITNASPATAVAGATALGGLSTSGELWKGGLDEVRISMVARTSNWIDAQHASMTGTLVSYGVASSSCP